MSPGKKTKGSYKFEHGLGLKQPSASLCILRSFSVTVSALPSDESLPYEVATQVTTQVTTQVL